MLGSIPHQKFCFYHLPTRGRATIKLGDAWYVSNVSIIFDCSMLLYLLFWTILGFIFHFYIIFGTNLLIGRPTRIAVCLPILVFRRKRISNRVQTEWNLRDRDFPTELDPGDLDPTPRSARGGHEGGGAPLGMPPTSWPPVTCLGIGSKSPGSYLLRKSRSQRFRSVWTPFDIPFLRNPKTGKKNSNSGLGLRLIG